MTQQDRVLCIDDEQAQCDLIHAALARRGYETVTTTSPMAALEYVANHPFDAIVTALSMREMDGLALCERLLGTRADLPAIVLTGLRSMESVVSALRVGVYDFLSKPIEANALCVRVARAVQHSKLRADLRRLQLALGERGAVRSLVCDSRAMRRVNELITRVGASDASVLICGETGSGKEMVAHALHDASPRRNGPFVVLNCAAIPPALLESELFGHACGAFTDAKTSRQGLFVESSGGTLFLDEIGDMPLEMQTKLLRALQERKVRPIGSNIEIPFDARIVTATRRDLEADVAKQRFREDLYYRINVVRIDVPALRERRSDLLTLAAFFMTTCGERSSKGALKLSHQAAERLMAYDWPGNVRELENCIERAVALARFDHLTVEDLPENIRAYRVDRSVMVVGETEEILSLREIERRYIAAVINRVKGNKAHASQLLGIDRRTLYRKLKCYEAQECEQDALARVGEA